MAAAVGVGVGTGVALGVGAIVGDAVGGAGVGPDDWDDAAFAEDAGVHDVPTE